MVTNRTVPVNPQKINRQCPDTNTQHSIWHPAQNMAKADDILNGANAMYLGDDLIDAKPELKC